MRFGPGARGGVLALAAAFAFGVSTPLVQRLGHGVGPFTTAAVLYAGSGLVALAPSREDAPLRPTDVPRLLVVVALGAITAPVAFAWGLQHTSGVTGALLLNLEVVFTVLLARLLWREPLGGRVAFAVAAIVGGGVLLVLDRQKGAITPGWGALAVAVATLGWAGDAVIGRPLADRSPTQVVLAKGVLGAATSLVLARVTSEAWPAWSTVAALAACGAVGYGLSLRCYLGAQRAVGAARTGTVFAAAPFLGAGVALVMGERAPTLVTLAAGALCALGVALNLTESHGRVHPPGADL